MILKNLFQSAKLKSVIKRFEHNRNVFDILVYGSVSRGKDKINDIDIVIILKKKLSLNKKLEMAVSLKEGLSFLDVELDVKTIDIYDLLDPSFIARQAIILEGYSLIKREYLHEYLGFKGSVLFEYDLSKLNDSQRKMFYYALNGRRGQEGLLKTRGKRLSDNLIKIDLIYSEEIKLFFEGHNINYKVIPFLTYS